MHEEEKLRLFSLRNHTLSPTCTRLLEPSFLRFRFPTAIANTACQSRFLPDFTNGRKTFPLGSP